MRIGIYNRWLHVLGGGERLTLGIAQALAKEHTVHVLSQHHAKREDIEARLDMDMANVHFDIWPDLPDEALSEYTVPYNLFINASHMSALAPRALKNLLLVYFPSWSGREWWQPPLSWLGRYVLRPALRFSAFRVGFERLLPSGLARLHRVPPPHFRRALSQYDLICTISRFSQQWIAQYWGLPSEILYPPVDVEALAPLKKRNIILSVGRFFVGGHNKKQLETVRAFKRLYEEGLRGWELHLAGGTSPGPQHQCYLARVQAEARGYPVFFHMDIPFETLQRLYGQAKIYWHASGYGEDVDRHPDRFEHFGITTVEAMAAGCVPVVIGKAGQREIVVDGLSGFLWQRLDELIKYTWQLIQNPALREKMSQRARQRSRDFGQDAFVQHIRRLVSQLERGISK